MSLYETNLLVGEKKMVNKKLIAFICSALNNGTPIWAFNESVNNDAVNES